MKCFEVTINGEKMCTAGIGDSGALTAIISFATKHNMLRNSRGKWLMLEGQVAEVVKQD